MPRKPPTSEYQNRNALETVIGAVTEAQPRLNEAMLSQEREGETRKARLEVLERFVTDKVNDALLKLPKETQNLHQRLSVLEASGTQSKWGDQTLESVIDNHQGWQDQVEGRLSDLIQDQQSKETRINERFNDQFAQSHSMNDRLMEKLTALERVVEEQRVQIVHLEANARMPKAEMKTPEKEISSGLDPKDPPGSDPRNANGETELTALKETVKRLSFWIMQITGAIDLGENPDQMAFPNTRTCRDLVKLKRDVETLQQKCDGCRSKGTGGDSTKVSSLEKTTEA